MPVTRPLVTQVAMITGEPITLARLAQSGISLPNFNAAPANVFLPFIGGIGQVNGTLTANIGAWQNSPTTFNYQWYRGNLSSPIAGATLSVYTPTAADTAKFLFVGVTANNAFGSNTAYSLLPAFGVYKSTLAGNVQILIYADAIREINHVKQSSSSGLIAGTRYNGSNPTESGGYLDTEIVLIDPVSGAITSVVPPNPAQNNSNPVWSVAGDLVVYSSSNVSSLKTGGRKYIIATGIDTEFYAPPDISVSDFSLDLHGNLLMSGHGGSVLGGLGSALFIRAADTGTRYQLTTPTITGSGNPLGDYDPHFSPDGTMAACPRATTVAGVFSICVIQVGSEAGSPPFKNNGETIIAPSAAGGSSTAFWGVPRWTSDSKLIISALYDPQNLALSGLYSMKPDGTGVPTRIPLQPEQINNMPTFAPDGSGGSSLTAGILFSTTLIPIFPAPGPTLVLNLDMRVGMT